MDVKELAKQYYPQYWSRKRLVSLVEAGKLTDGDYKEITGCDYPTES